jgi:hypothetical protein
MSIDISTHQLAEQTCKALGGKVSLEDILTIWHAIGKSPLLRRELESCLVLQQPILQEM